MSMIDSEAQDFTVRAYQDYEFRPVTKEDLKGNGAYSSSIRLTSPLSARPNSRICRTSTLNSRRSALRSTPSPVTPSTSTKHGTTTPRPSEK